MVWNYSFNPCAHTSIHIQTCTYKPFWRNEWIIIYGCVNIAISDVQITSWVCFFVGHCNFIRASWDIKGAMIKKKWAQKKLDIVTSQQAFALVKTCWRRPKRNDFSSSYEKLLRCIWQKQTTVLWSFLWSL